VRDPWHGSNWSMRTSVILAVRTSSTFSKARCAGEIASKPASRIKTHALRHHIEHTDLRHRRLLRPRRKWLRSRAAEQRYELAASHVWMAPAWQEIIWRAAQRSLAVMCPACWCSPGGCVDGPRLARDHLACSAEVACSHVSGLLVQSGWTAGPDGVREPRPHHSTGSMSR
jgi:hypothetical protein